MTSTRTANSEVVALICCRVCTHLAHTLFVLYARELRMLSLLIHMYIVCDIMCSVVIITNYNISTKVTSKIL